MRYLLYLMVLLASAWLPTFDPSVQAQVACFNYGNMVACDDYGNDRRTLIFPSSPSSGGITTYDDRHNRSTYTPYTITPPPPSQPERNALDSLRSPSERNSLTVPLFLPYGGGSSGDSWRPNGDR